MKIETTVLEDQQTRLTTELDSETLEKYKRQAARKIAQKTRFPGFRPGKAPYEMVRRTIGDETLTQEALELMLDDVYPQALKEANIEPSGQGRLEKIVSMDPPIFEFVIPLPPVVELGDYKSIKKEYTPEPVTDEQIDTTLRRLQRNYSTAEPVERAAEAGDLVSFKLTASRTTPVEGQPDTLVEETPYQMVAGEDPEDEAEVWPYEGFTQELVGMSADENKTVTHTFSEESPYEDLRGIEAAFTITVQNVKKMTLPELNDEFAQNLGEFETMEDLRKVIRSQLEQQYSQQYDQNYFETVITELVEQSTVKFPPQLLDNEIEEFIHGVQHNLERDHLDLETYLKMREMDRETFVEQEVKPAATRRLIRSLVLEEFARQEKIEIKNEEVRSVFAMVQQQMSQMPPARGKGRQNNQEMVNSLAINTVNNIFNQRMMARLKALASGQEEEAVTTEPENVEAAMMEEVLEDVMEVATEEELAELAMELDEELAEEDEAAEAADNTGTETTADAGTEEDAKDA